MKTTCPSLPSVLLVLFCLSLLAEQTVAQGTFYTDEATFLSATGSGGIFLNLESFESASGSAPITVGDINVSNTGGSLVSVSPDQSTDGSQAIRWSSSASGPITYTFANPINAFGIDILDLGTPGLADLTLTTTTGSTLLFNDFTGGPGNQLFGGYVDLSQSFTSVTFENTAAGDIVYFDRLLYGEISIWVDPNDIGATDVLLDPFGTPTPLTNPVLGPLLTSDLSVGHSGVGHLGVFDSGVISVSGSIGVGRLNGADGNLEIDGGTVGAEQLDIGGFGTGTLLLENGGEVITGRFNLGAGFQPGSLAKVDGAGTRLLISALVPASGLRLISGSMNVTGGANVIVSDGGSGFSYIGGTGTTADLLIDGAGSLVQLDEDFDIGGFWSSQPAVAMVTIQNQGAMSVGGSTNLGESDDTLTIDGGSLTTGSLDNSNGGTINHLDGTLTIDGGTFDNGGGFLGVGSTSGNPTMRLINGATASQTDAYIGENTNEAATFDVSGAGSQLTTSSEVRLGANGSGVMLVNDSASVMATGRIYLGDNPGSSGDLTVDNGATISSGDVLIVGYEGNGHLEVKNGASATAQWVNVGAINRSPGTL